MEKPLTVTCIVTSGVNVNQIPGIILSGKGNPYTDYTDGADDTEIYDLSV